MRLRQQDSKAGKATPELDGIAASAGQDAKSSITPHTTNAMRTRREARDSPPFSCLDCGHRVTRDDRLRYTGTERCHLPGQEMGVMNHELCEAMMDGLP